MARALGRSLSRLASIISFSKYPCFHLYQTHGRTGFPWIDALMRQLRQTGWIHHLGRHSVACFLTRGQAYISWERGMEVFDELLLDWDPASNPGNWQWSVQVPFCFCVEMSVREDSAEVLRIRALRLSCSAFYRYDLHP